MKNDAFFHSTLDHLLEGCQIIDFDWKYLFINRAAEIHNRRPNSELLGRHYREMWPGIETTEVYRQIAETFEKRTPNRLENQFTYPNGSIGWFDLSIQPIPEGVFILSIDITERKIAEEKLRESEEKYRIISDNSDDWIYWVSPDGRLHYVSPACERVTGYSPEEFLNRPELTHEIVAEADKDKVRQHTHLLKRDNAPHNLEFRIVTKNGELRWISHSCSPILSDDGQYLGRRATNRNITERKQQEEQLFESEFRFGKLYEEGPFGMVMADAEFRFKKVNPAFCSILGYTEEELIKQTFKDVSHPDDIQKDLVNIRKLTNREISVYKTEKRYIRKDGQSIWGSLTVTATYDSEGQFLYYLGIIEDISFRKQAEETLRERENKLSTILNLLPVGISILDQEQKIVYENPALENILGITVEGMRQGNFSNRKYLRADGSPKPAEEFASTRAFKEKTTQHNFITGVVKEDGDTVWTNVSAVPVEFPDWKVVLVTADITSVKQAEDALKKSKQLLSETESVGKVGGWEFNIDTLKQQWTDEVYRIHEVDSDFNPNVNTGINFYAPASRPIIENAVQRAVTFGEPFDLELEIITAKGNLRKVHSIGRADLENRRVYGFFQDITERKLMEEQLRQSEQRFASMFNLGPVAKSLASVTERVFIDFNKAAELMFEINRNEIIGKSPNELDFWVHPEEQQIVQELHKKQGYIHGYEFQYKTATGKTGWASGYAEIIEINGKKYSYNEYVDITKRKQAENEIKNLNERIETATKSAQVGIWDWDVLNNKLTWDEQMYTIYGVKKEEFAGAYEAWVSGLHPDDKEHGTTQTQLALKGEKDYDTEFRVVWPNGTIRHCKAKGEVFRNEKGEPIRMVGVNYDITERKQREETLRKLEYVLSEGQKIAHMGTFEFVVETQTTYWSAEEYSIYGLDPAEPSPPYEVMLAKCIHPDDADLLNQTFTEALQSNSVYELEHRIIRPDGSIRWVFDRAKPYFDQSGKLVRYVGATLDITERRHNEEKVRQKDQEFRKLSANVPDLIFQFTRKPDGSYCVPIASEGIRNIFGCSPEDVVDDFTPIGRVIHPDDAERVIRDIEYSAEHMTFFNCEFRVQIPGREIQWIYSKSTPERLPDGSITWYGFNTDITHKKHAEEALRESEEKFRNLIESLPLPVTYVNNRGEIVFRNDRFLQVMGYTQEEVPTVNEWWGKAYPDEKYQKQVVRQWGSAVEHAKLTDSDIDPIEYNITCKDGIQRTMIVSGIIIDDNLLITFIDITDRKKAEEEIRKLNETLEERVDERTKQLQDANQELEAFSYSVSHDLRAPLRHINGFVDLLTENYTDILPEKGKHYLEVIVNSSRHMGTLIDDLLQFSRTGRQEMQKTDLNMNMILRDAINSVGHEDHSRKIEWELAELPTLKGDQSLMRMVWVNLLSNAVKFTKAKNPAKIQIGYTDDSKEFTFFVRDNGAGFDMRFAHKLFGVFQRLHTTKEFEGTGIGLANVRRIILKHGGRTWAESQINEGATFYFTLPKPKS